MQAMLEMGFDIDLTMLEVPDITKLENAFGSSLASVIKNTGRIHVLQMLDEQSINTNMKNNYDLLINTHGDIDPYYNDMCNKRSMITYCHFPSAKRFIETEDRIYLEKHIKISRMELSSNFEITPSNGLTTHNPQISLNTFDKKNYMKWLKFTYDNMIRNSTLITNSWYSHQAIFETYGIKDTAVVYPPIDVDMFRTAALRSSTDECERQDSILVICRIDPTKQLENAIYLAKEMDKRNIGKEMIIIGNLDPFYQKYYYKLKQMVIDFNLSNYIRFEINSSLDKMLDYLKISKVIFHPKFGEHFGMSIVEAMSAGLIPVVPTIGGPREFISSKYQYNTIEQALPIVSTALKATNKERINISNSVSRFSTSTYKKKFQGVVSRLMNTVIPN